MDGCLMAAQVLAHCVSHEPQSTRPSQDDGGVILATEARVAPTPSPTTGTIGPETGLWVSVEAPQPPAAGTTCSVREPTTEPKPEPEPEVCPTVLGAATTYPLSLPLHPDGALSSAATGDSSPAASRASLLPPIQMTPRISRVNRERRLPQVSRAILPQEPVQPAWANTPRPLSGAQMYQFRLASLRAGQLYTRTTPQRYLNHWQATTATPSYTDWQTLLQSEARVMARAQGPNRLTVVIGDSLSLWLPSEGLPGDRFWLNQSISGETTSHILRRLHYFASTRPDTIHLMAGINDLKNGAPDAQVINTMAQILTRLRQQHPQAKIVLHSLLPTRWNSLPSDRIRRVNTQLAYVANQQGAIFVDLQPTFTDAQGQLRRELTTDGLHLSYQGYEVWRAALMRY